MKSFFVLLIVLLSNVAFAQNKECSRLSLGDAKDSMDVVKQTIEQHLQTQLKFADNEGSKTVYELKDKEDITNLKIWMKQKRSVIGGDVAVTYSISSFKVIGIADRIENLFKVLKEKVASCSTATSDLSVTFPSGKITVEKQGGDWSKKNLQMWTLTVTTAK